MNKHYDVVVIGAGTSGLLSAIFLKKQQPNLSICIVEKSDKIGKKLKASGNGRANISPKSCLLSNFHSHDLTRVNEILDEDPVQSALRAWKSLGLEVTYLADGIYPRSLKAESILNLIAWHIDTLSIDVLLNSKLENYKIMSEKIQVHTDHGNLTTQALLISTGGQAYPALGGNSDVYKLLETKGYVLCPQYPALDSFILDYNTKRLAGVKIRAGISIYETNTKRKIGQDIGEVNYNKSGISGIPIMQLSALYNAHHAKDLESYETCKFNYYPNRVAEETLRGREAEAYFQEIISPSLETRRSYNLVLDFFPDFTLQELETFLQAKAQSFREDRKLILLSLFPEALARDLEYYIEKHQIHEKRLAKQLKSWAYPILSSSGFGQCQASTGGVHFTNLKVDSLQSAREEGVFFSGEILDCFGDCGGYNILWANRSSEYVVENILEYLGANLCGQ